MRKKLKPDLGLDSINTSLLEEINNAYKRYGSLNKTAKALGLSLMKVRKALITTGSYSSPQSEEVERLSSAGKTVGEIAVLLNISPAAVYGYMPYKMNAYKLTERGEPVRSVPADAVCRYRERKSAVEKLKRDIEHGSDWKGSSGSLWKCMVLFAGQKFRKAGRGAEHKGAVGFTYQLKVSSRTGAVTDELIISSRPDGKTITRSSVELCLERMLEVQKKQGYVKGPKSAGQIFGASYLYAVFLKFGVIKSAVDSDG